MLLYWYNYWADFQSTVDTKIWARSEVITTIFFENSDNFFIGCSNVHI